MLMLLLCHQLLFIHWNLHILRYFSKFFDFYVERIFDASLYYLKAHCRFSSPIMLNTVKMANMLRTAFCNKNRHNFSHKTIKIQIQKKWSEAPVWPKWGQRRQPSWRQQLQPLCLRLYWIIITDEDVADDDDSSNDDQTSLIIYSDSVNDDIVPCCRLCWRS